MRHNICIIQMFSCKRTESIWKGLLVKGIFVEIQNVCRRKLRMINSARSLEDLRVPPGNRLEALKGSRKSQYSIRVNQQWRICFNWKDKDAYKVHLVDYH